MNLFESDIARYRETGKTIFNSNVDVELDADDPNDPFQGFPKVKLSGDDEKDTWPMPNLNININKNKFKPIDEINPSPSIGFSTHQSYVDHCENVSLEESTIDQLRLAGVIDEWEEKTWINESTESGQQGIRRLLKKLFPMISINLATDYLFLNDIQTSICVVYIKDLYVGLSGLKSHVFAIETISEMIKERLDPLFNIKEEVIEIDNF